VAAGSGLGAAPQQTSGLSAQQYQDLSNLLFSQIAPTVGLENQAVNLAQAQAGIIPEETALQTGYLGQQYQNQLAQQQLSQQGLVGQQQYLATQEGVYPQQFALEQAGLQQQLAELAANYAPGLQQIQGQAAAAGAANTVGARTAQQQYELQANPETGYAAQDIQRALQQAGLSNQLQNANFALQNLQTGLPGSNSLAQQSLALQTQGLGEQYGYNLQNAQLQGAFSGLGAQQGVLGQQAGIIGQILQNQAPLGLLGMAVNSGGSNAGN
jgi:hypothetical protein